MSFLDRRGKIIETTLRSRGAENSKNSLVVLTIGLLAIAIAGGLLLWYFIAVRHHLIVVN
jgi:hypothetical protein